MGLLAIITLGVAGYLGWVGIPWFWCILIAIINCPIYYAGKPEGQMASDIESYGGPKWFAWISLSQLATTSIIYGIGYLFGQVLF